MTNPNPSPELRDALEASLAKRSVPTMDPPYTAAFNAALDMVARDTVAARAPSPHTPLSPGEVETHLRREVAAVINEMSRQMPNSTEDWRARLTEALA